MPATRQSAYCTVGDWSVLTGMSRSETYDAISTGDLHTIKMGARTLIDVQAGLRFLDSLPQADIRIARAPRREPRAQERYAEQSARYPERVMNDHDKSLKYNELFGAPEPMFADALGDPIADSILAALRQAPDGLTRTQISEVFGRNMKASELARGLQVLHRAGLAAPEERNTGGRPATVWRAIQEATTPIKNADVTKHAGNGSW